MSTPLLRLSVWLPLLKVLSSFHFLQVSTDKTSTGGLSLESLTEILLSHEAQLDEMTSSLCDGPGADIGAEEEVRKIQAAVTTAIRNLVTAPNEHERDKTAKVLADTLKNFMEISSKLTANLADMVSQQAVIKASKDVIAQTSDLVIDAAMLQLGEREQSPNMMANVKKALQKFSSLCSGHGCETTPPDVNLLYLEESDDDEDEDQVNVLSDEGYSEEEFDVVNACDWYTWYQNQYFVPERVS